MLSPLKQFYCDTCGQLIERPEDGYAEYKIEAKNVDYVYTDFIIVHHLIKLPLGGRSGCYQYDCSVDLPSLLGDIGKVRLLSLLDPGSFHFEEYYKRVEDIRGWTELFKRLQIPYYEEGRLYLNRAFSDGSYDGVNEIYTYSPEHLKELINHYEIIDKKL